MCTLASSPSCSRVTSLDEKPSNRFLSSTPLITCLSVGCLIDTLNGCIQQGVVLGRGLLSRQPLHQRPRKTRHNPVVPAQAPVAFFPCISARQCNHPHNLGMPDALGVEIVLLRQGELEHDHLTR